MVSRRIAGSLAVVAVLGAGLYLGVRRPVAYGGPLGNPRLGADWSRSGASTLPDRPEVIGVFLEAPRNVDVTADLDGLFLIAPTPGLDARAYVGTSCPVGAVRWPPKDCGGLHPVKGWVVHPYRNAVPGFQFVMRMSASRPGLYAFLGVRLDYHVGSAHYRAIYLEGGTLCIAPRKSLVPHCDDNEAQLDAGQLELADLVQSDVGLRAVDSLAVPVAS